MAKRSLRADAGDPAGTPAPARPRARTGKAAAQAKPAPQGAPETAGPPETAHAADDAGAAMPQADEAARKQPRSMASEPSEEDIRTRAYHLYLERGRRHGAHEDDWYRAEQELKNRNNK